MSAPSDKPAVRRAFDDTSIQHTTFRDAIHLDEKNAVHAEPPCGS